MARYSQHAPWIGAKPLPVKDRPKCLWCGKTLRPHGKWDRVEGRGFNYTRTLDGYGYDGHSSFHKLNCAADWARWAVRMLKDGVIPNLMYNQQKQQKRAKA